MTEKTLLTIMKDAQKKVHFLLVKFMAAKMRIFFLIQFI